MGKRGYFFGPARRRGRIVVFGPARPRYTEAVRHGQRNGGGDGLKTTAESSSLPGSAASDDARAPVSVSGLCPFGAKTRAPRLRFAHGQSATRKRGAGDWSRSPQS